MCLSGLLVWFQLLFESCHLSPEGILVVDEGEVQLINAANDEFEHLVGLIPIGGVLLKF